MKPSNTLANISSIETMGLVDGPGIRVVFFLQGCNLRCVYCHNPETWSKNINKLMSIEEVIEKVLKYKSYIGKHGGRMEARSDVSGTVILFTLSK